MGGGLLDDYMSIEQRLDSVITFALIGFVHDTLATAFDTLEVALVSGVVLLTLRGVCNTAKLSALSAVRQIVELLEKLAVMVLSQALISLVTQDSRILRMRESNLLLLFVAFVVTTNVLVLVSLLAYSFSSVDAVSRSMTLLLYIYADATEIIVQRIELGRVSAALLCLLIWLVFLALDVRRAFKALFAVQYVLSATNMVCINVVLQSLVDVDASRDAAARDSFLLLVVLFLLDSLAQVDDRLTEARNYAIWKGSQKLFFVFRALDVSLDAMLLLSLGLLYSRPLWKGLLSAVFELALLVVVNVVLDLANAYIAAAYTVDKAVLLFTYVVLLHQATGLVFMQPRAAKT